MRVNRIPRTIAAAVLAGGLVLSGCSNDTAAEEPELGPLDEYLQVLWDGEEWTEERYKQEEEQRQEFIAQCMTEQGWEYIPVPYQGGFFTSDEAEEEGPAWGTLEFAKQYGYGIVSWPGDDEIEEPTDPGEQYVDPNDDYVNSLSESEQMAYYEALHGDQSAFEYEELDEDGNPIEPEIDWNEMGCYGKAQGETMGEQPYDDPEFQAFERMNEVWATWENNDEMAALESEWASCMSGKGYSFANHDEAMNHIYDLSNQMWEDIDWEANPEGPSQETQDQFQAQEIEQAVADFECSEEVDYSDRQQEISFALQQKFLDENRAELDAMVAKYGKE